MDVPWQENIKKYASEGILIKENQMDLDATETETRLDHTIQELKDRVKEQQEALGKLLALSGNFPTQPSDDPRERLQQLQTLTAVYRNLTESSPSLPARGSGLAPVIAIDLIQETITGGKNAAKGVQSQVAEATARVAGEEAALNDAKLMGDALSRRINALHNQREEQSQKNPAQVARDLLNTAQKKKKSYRRETQWLQKALDNFIETNLGAMLAAEELGGPVVGNMMEVNDDALISGFSSQGRAKKGKNVSEDKRQRRIDQVWGGGHDEEIEQPNSEKEASAQEAKELFTELYEALLGKDSSGSYIEITRDSATSRFLVRAKVAQFHPKDARKLRLVDFGRELDD